MSKKFLGKTLITAGLAATMLFPLNVFAAPQDGLYVNDKGYNLSYLATLSGPDQVALFSQLNNAASKYIVQGGKVVDWRAFAFSNFATVAQMVAADPSADQPGVVTSTTTFVDASGQTVAADPDLVATDLKVASVSAINPLTLEVKFNNQVKADSAQTAGNYALNTVGFPGGTTFTLQADKKTVVIALPWASKLLNASSQMISVTGVVGLDQVAMPVGFNQVVSFNDTVAPTLGVVSYPDNNTAQVSFSEPMTTFTSIAVKVFDETGADVTAGNLGLKATVADGAKDVQIDLTGATVNKNYSVKIYGALDASGNAAGTKSFTVVKTIADTTAPTIASVTPVALDTFKVKFSEKVTTDAVNSIRYGTFAIDGATVTGNLVNGDPALVAAPNGVVLSADGTELTVKLAAALTSGLHTVQVNNFLDASLNKQTTAFSKIVNFAADTVAPKVLSTSVANISGTDYLLLKFDDSDIVLGTGAASNPITLGTYTADSVENSSAAFGTATLHDPDGDGKTDTIKIPLTTKPAGVYSVGIAANVVKDKATVANNNAAAALSFTYNGSISIVKPAVVDAGGVVTDGISSGYTAQSTTSPNDVTLTFSKDVTPETALNVGNYLVDGQAVFAKAVFVGDKHTVRLTLKTGAINASTNYSFNISNVADAAGHVMNPVTFVQIFNENVAPTLVSATLTAPDTIQLTFSEDVKATSIEGNKLAADAELVIKSGTTALTLAASSTVAQNGGLKHFDVKLATALTADQLAAGLTVTVVDTNSIVDNSSVENKFGSTAVTKTVQQ